MYTAMCRSNSSFMKLLRATVHATHKSALVRSLILVAALSMCRAATEQEDEFEKMYKEYENSGRPRRANRARARPDFYRLAMEIPEKKTPEELYAWMINEDTFDQALVCQSIDHVFTESYEYKWTKTQRQEFCRRLIEKITFFDLGTPVEDLFIPLFSKAVQMEFEVHFRESHTEVQETMVGSEKVRTETKIPGLEWALHKGAVRDSYCLSMNMLDAYWKSLIRQAVPCAEDIRRARKSKGLREKIKKYELEFCLQEKAEDVSTSSSWVPAKIVKFMKDDTNTIQIQYRTSPSREPLTINIDVTKPDERIKIRGAVVKGDQLFALMPSFWENLQRWERRSQGWLHRTSYIRGIDWSEAFRKHGSNMREANTRAKAKGINLSVELGFDKDQKLEQARERKKKDAEWLTYLNSDKKAMQDYNRAMELITKWECAVPEDKPAIEADLQDIYKGFQTTGSKRLRKPELIEVTQVVEQHIQALVEAMKQDFKNSNSRRANTSEARLMRGCSYALAALVQDYHTNHPKKLGESAAILYMRRYSTFGVNYPKILTVTGMRGWGQNQNRILEVLKSIAGIPGKIGLESMKKVVICDREKKRYSQYGVRENVWIKNHITLIQTTKHLFPAGHEYTLRDKIAKYGAAAEPSPEPSATATATEMSVVTATGSATPEDEQKSGDSGDKCGDKAD